MAICHTFSAYDNAQRFPWLSFICSFSFWLRSHTTHSLSANLFLCLWAHFFTPFSHMYTFFSISFRYSSARFFLFFFSPSFLFMVLCVLQLSCCTSIIVCSTLSLLLLLPLCRSFFSPSCPHFSHSSSSSSSWSFSFLFFDCILSAADVLKLLVFIVIVCFIHHCLKWDTANSSYCSSSKKKWFSTHRILYQIRQRSAIAAAILLIVCEVCNTMARKLYMMWL